MYIAEESTFAILPVCCLFLLLSLCCLPHAGYSGGTTMKRMVAMMTGREDNIAEESTLAILPVCCFVLLGGEGLISLLSPTCWLWRRDNDEEDGGDEDGTRRQHVHCRKKYVGYTTCLLFNFVVISLLSPTYLLWRRDNDEEDGGDDDGREDNIAEEGMLAILPVCCFVLLGGRG